MFRVMIEEFDNRGVQRTLDLTMKTEKLYEVLGRYLTKYGVPDELVCERGFREIEYCKEINNGFIGALVSFVRIEKSKKEPREKVSYTKESKWTSKHYPPPAAPTVVDEPPEERLKEMIDKDVLSKWG